MDQKQVLNIYYDNGIYVQVTATGNESLADNLFDSLIQQSPSLNNGLCNFYFTWSSLLEAIGLGNFGDKNKPRLDLSPFAIGRHDQNVEKKLIDAYSYAEKHFLNHPVLSAGSLLDKIQTQISHSSNRATADIHKDTLIRYQQSLLTSPRDSQKSLAQHLAWNAVCEYPFAAFLNIKDQDQDTTRNKVRKINEWLLRIFHDKQSEGIDLSSYRLADKIQKELLSSSEYLNISEKPSDQGKYRWYIPHLLEDRKDLGDADAIHFATFGYKGSPGIVITADKPEVIRQRMIIQLSVMHFLCAAENTTLKLTPGTVLFADAKTCTIYDRLDVRDLKNEDCITMVLHELTGRRKRSLVTFKK